MVMALCREGLASKYEVGYCLRGVSATGADSCFYGPQTEKVML
jgi:hypothetical protein